jgi:hypothetical protein
LKVANSGDHVSPYINTVVDPDYWSAILGEATINCCPFGFDFGERKRETTVEKGAG